MKKLRICVLAAVLLVICITAAACAPTVYAGYKLQPNEYLMGEDSSGGAYTPDGAAVQLTQEDIQAMNGGKAHMVFGNKGYLSFLNGRYYEGKITDHEDAVTSIQGMAQLLGLGFGCEFFAKYGETDEDGYTYYTFHQRFGDATVQFATLRVIVDPDGYSAGLSCSFIPNIGVADEIQAVTPERALEVVKAEHPNDNYTYYPEATRQVAVALDYVTYNAYAIYTNNPNMTSSFDMAYYEHFVRLDGTYLYSLPVATMVTENVDPFKANAYFEGLQQTTFSCDVRLYDSSIKHIEVPMAYNPSDGLYYLCDVGRKIIVADHRSVYYDGVLRFITSTDGKSWSNQHLLAYSNYIKAYDFYASLGLDSVDDFGTPVLVCVGMRDAFGQPEYNAYHFGMNMGFVCFAASDDYTLNEALDIITHEFTHGVTTYSMGDNLYQNETGAINEAYSDIMGNICEMLLGETNDTRWLVGEMSGEPMRSMSSPNDYGQPASENDTYYYPPTNTPGNDNDNGGVHINSSLLNSVAYALWKAGMPLADEAELWLTSMELITPKSSYNEVHGALLMSVDINGFDQAYKQVITDAFNAAALLD